MNNRLLITLRNVVFLFPVWFHIVSFTVVADGIVWIFNLLCAFDIKTGLGMLVVFTNLSLIEDLAGLACFMLFWMGNLGRSALYAGISLGSILSSTYYTLIFS